MNEDKRGAERHSLSVPILYANLTKPGSVTYSYQHSSTLDISASGVGLVLEENVDKSDLIQVVLILPASPFVLTALAQAVWTFRSGDGQQYRAGLRFVQPYPDLNEALAKQKQ